MHIPGPHTDDSGDGHQTQITFLYIHYVVAHAHERRHVAHAHLSAWDFPRITTLIMQSEWHKHASASALRTTATDADMHLALK